MVLGREDVARGPADLRAESGQRLDQHRGLDRHVQRAGDPRALQRLRRAEFLAQRHQARHLGLGDLDLLAAEVGEADVGDHIIAGRALGLGRHVRSPEEMRKTADAKIRRSRAGSLAAAARKCKYKDIFICAQLPSLIEAKVIPHCPPGSAGASPSRWAIVTSRRMSPAAAAASSATDAVSAQTSRSVASSP